MSVLAGIRASLDALGAEQQAFLFVFLVSYPLALGALLESRARRWAGAVAAAALAGFVLATDPWMHAVLMVAFMVGALGLFIVLVWLLDRLSRVAARPRRLAAARPGEAPACTPEGAREREGAPPRALPLTGRAGTT